MARKKKKDAVNAIDKYIKQIKYRAEFKKPEKTKIRQPKVVISRIKSRRLEEYIDPPKNESKENKTVGKKVPNAKISRKRKTEVSKLDVPSLAEAIRKPVASDLSKERKNRTTKSRNLASNSNRTEKTSNNLREKRKKKIIKTVLPSGIEREEENAEKLKHTSEDSHNVEKSIKQLRSKTRSIVKADIVKRKSSIKVTKTKTKSSLISAHLQNNENVFVAAEEPISKNQNSQTENRENISETEESSQPTLVSNEPCLCEPTNLGIRDFSEENTISLFPNRYRSCVEELKSLSAESITKFVNDNKQHYKDLKRADNTRKITANGRKKRRNELKDSFKCNPFNSVQQLAMYNALREVFEAPSGAFVEYRFFFTLLIPEICCQLFAQIFKVKTSFAPRLIKKLYSEPVCPV